MEDAVVGHLVITDLRHGFGSESSEIAIGDTVTQQNPVLRPPVGLVVIAEKVVSGIASYPLHGTEVHPTETATNQGWGSRIPQKVKVS